MGLNGARPHGGAACQAEEAGSAAVEEMLRIGDDSHARRVLDVALRRLGRTWYNRVNPIKLDHPAHSRFTPLAALDARLFHPAVLRRARANP